MRIRTIAFLTMLGLAIFPLLIHVMHSLPGISDKFQELIREENQARLQADLVELKSRIQTWENQVRLISLIPGTMDIAEKRVAPGLGNNLIYKRYFGVVDRWFRGIGELDYLNIFTEGGDLRYVLAKQNLGHLKAFYGAELEKYIQNPKNPVSRDSYEGILTRCEEESNVIQDPQSFTEAITIPLHSNSLVGTQEQKNRVNLLLSNPIYRGNRFIGRVSIGMSIDRHIQDLDHYIWITGAGMEMKNIGAHPEYQSILIDRLRRQESFNNLLKKGKRFTIALGELTYSWEPLLVSSNPETSIWIGLENDKTEIEEWLAQMQDKEIITFMVITTFLILLAIRLSRSMQATSDSIIQGLRDVLTNQKKARFAWRWPKELKELADGLNEVSSEYIKAETARKEVTDELQRLNVTLEEQVEERTSDLQRANEALTESLEKLTNTQNELVVKEKMATLGVLSAGVAHEIKNPLNFIINYASIGIENAENLEEKLKDNPELKDLVEEARFAAKTILEHGERADQIISEMLRHSKGKSDFSEKVHIQSLIEKGKDLALQEIRMKFPDFYFEIEMKVESELPEVQVVYSSLIRVMINLLNNSAYALEERIKVEDQSFQPRVGISVGMKGSDILNIRIEDNGCGIDEEHLAKIFDPFYTTKAAGRGTGLGLFICYDIITSEHKGTMTVESRKGEFTRFEIGLPVNSEDIEQSS